LSFLASGEDAVGEPARDRQAGVVDPAATRKWAFLRGAERELVPDSAEDAVHLVADPAGRRLDAVGEALEQRLAGLVQPGPDVREEAQDVVLEPLELVEHAAEIVLHAVPHVTEDRGELVLDRTQCAGHRATRVAQSVRDRRLDVVPDALEEAPDGIPDAGEEGLDAIPCGIPDALEGSQADLEEPQDADIPGHLDEPDDQIPDALGDLLDAVPGSLPVASEDSGEDLEDAHDDVEGALDGLGCTFQCADQRVAEELDEELDDRHQDRKHCLQRLGEDLEDPGQGWP